MRLCWRLKDSFQVYDLGGLSDLTMFVTDLQLTLPPTKPIGAVPIRLFSRNPGSDASDPDDALLLVDTATGSGICPSTVTEWSTYAATHVPTPVTLGSRTEFTGNLFNNGTGQYIFVDMRPKTAVRSTLNKLVEREWKEEGGTWLGVSGYECVRVCVCGAKGEGCRRSTVRRA